MRIVVLTFNRPRSLARLLRSLEAAHYDFPRNNPGWDIILEIRRIDGGGGEDGNLVRNVARNFRFSHGTKKIVTSDTNRGIMAAWREAWSWRNKEMFIVIEDDVEMSLMWYRALVNMWTAYGDRDYIAGIGLQNQKVTVVAPFQQNITDTISDPVFFYELPSSIGSSPHPCHWTRMVNMYGDKFGECPGKMRCKDAVWESWFTKYHQDNTLYTLYPAHQDAFALDHRERGYHHEETQGNACHKIHFWNKEREAEHLPPGPPMFDLWLKNNAAYGGYQVCHLVCPNCSFRMFYFSARVS